VDLRRQIAIIRPWLPLLVVSVLLAGGVAFAVSSVLPKNYEAKATLIVGQSLSGNPDINQLLVSQRLSTTYAAVATQRPILDAVVKELGLEVPSSDLAKRVRADAPLDSTLLTISAQDADPARAAAIANTVAEQLIAASPAIQGREADIQASIAADVKATQNQIEETQAQAEILSAVSDRTPKQDANLDTLESRLVSLRSTLAALLSLSSGNASNLLTVIAPAIAPTDAISPNRVQNTFLAAALALLLIAGVIALVELLYDGVRDPDAIRDVAGLSTLGTIARMKSNRSSSEMYQLASLLYPHSAVAEAYRTLRTNVEFSSVDAPIRTLLVTSSMPGEGKTVTAANLAVVFAQAGRRVLLVDTDLRKPGVHLIFDLPNAHGLTTLLRNADVSLEAIVQATEQENLRILTTGPLPPNPAELAGSKRMRTVVDLLTSAEDLVIFDSPPLQAVTDAAILGSFLDATIFVIDAQHSKRRGIRQAREALAKAGANVLGAVLNRVPTRASDNSPYYGGYGRYDEAGAGPAPMPDAAP
jgi:succinoglycan biosynthesis transport protein ExoP